MNYKLHYEALIHKHGLVKRPIEAIGFERHHILPKSLGGDNSVNNLVYLTGRQHLLAHWLLYKIHKGVKMSMAFFLMRANKSNYLLTPIERKASESAMRLHGLMSKSVITPLGSFNSYRDAATAHNLPESTFQDLLRKGIDGFLDLGSLRSVVAAANGNHGMSRRIKTPLGYFPYVGAASSAHGISNKTISRRCEENPDDYYYLDPPKQARFGAIACNTKRVITPQGTFNSIAEAAGALGISRCTLRYKLKSANMPDYHVE